MDREPSLFAMETSMWGNSRKGNFMVKEHSLHLMETSMKENGRKECDMDLEKVNGEETSMNGTEYDKFGNIIGSGWME